MKMLLAFVLCWLAVPQDDPIKGLVERLRTDDIEVRDAAESALAARTEADVPHLRKLESAETDPEVKERLARAIDRITGLDWNENLDEAKKKAALAKKRLFVVSAPGPIRGAT